MGLAFLFQETFMNRRAGVPPTARRSQADLANSDALSGGGAAATETVARQFMVPMRDKNHGSHYFCC
ncbi:MAG: hypothetical protein DME26_07385 [Verrucomicrobia bacterium]|nr:MAG: hypothetical protein DME26_07385 [Verrucomicrobiota bacterium]